MKWMFARLIQLYQLSLTAFQSKISISMQCTGVYGHLAVDEKTGPPLLAFLPVLCIACSEIHMHTKNAWDSIVIFTLRRRYGPDKPIVFYMYVHFKAALPVQHISNLRVFVYFLTISLKSLASRAYLLMSTIKFTHNQCESGSDFWWLAPCTWEIFIFHSICHATTPCYKNDGLLHVPIGLRASTMTGI